MDNIFEKDYQKYILYTNLILDSIFEYCENNNLEAILRKRYSSPFELSIGAPLNRDSENETYFAPKITSRKDIPQEKLWIFSQPYTENNQIYQFKDTLYIFLRTNYLKEEKVRDFIRFIFKAIPGEEKKAAQLIHHCFWYQTENINFLLYDGKDKETAKKDLDFIKALPEPILEGYLYHHRQKNIDIVFNNLYKCLKSKHVDVSEELLKYIEPRYFRDEKNIILFKDIVFDLFANHRDKIFNLSHQYEFLKPFLQDNSSIFEDEKNSYISVKFDFEKSFASMNLTSWTFNEYKTYFYEVIDIINQDILPLNQDLSVEKFYLSRDDKCVFTACLNTSSSIQKDHLKNLILDIFNNLQNKKMEDVLIPQKNRVSNCSALKRLNDIEPLFLNWKLNNTMPINTKKKTSIKI